MDTKFDPQQISKLCKGELQKESTNCSLEVACACSPRLRPQLIEHSPTMPKPLLPVFLVGVLALTAQGGTDAACQGCGTTEYIASTEAFTTAVKVAQATAQAAATEGRPGVQSK